MRNSEMYSKTIKCSTQETFTIYIYFYKFDELKINMGREKLSFGVLICQLVCKSFLVKNSKCISITFSSQPYS